MSARVQWWLAELDRYGNPRLYDGAHDGREGVEQAAYLLGRLGMDGGRRFACARVELTDVEPKSHGANEEAIATMNAVMGRTPIPDSSSTESDDDE